MHTSIGQDKLVIKKKSLCLPHQDVLFLQLQGMPTIPYSTWTGVGKQQTCNLQQSFLRNECCCLYIVLEQKPACTLYSLFAGVKYCFIHVHFFLPSSKGLTLAECFKFCQRRPGLRNCCEEADSLVQLWKLKWSENMAYDVITVTPCIREHLLLESDPLELLWLGWNWKSLGFRAQAEETGSDSTLVKL